MAIVMQVITTHLIPYQALSPMLTLLFTFKVLDSDNLVQRTRTMHGFTTSGPAVIRMDDARRFTQDAPS